MAFVAELPIGTVTFLFTDIEGSTELVTKLGDRYPALLERHNALCGKPSRGMLGSR